MAYRTIQEKTTVRDAIERGVADITELGEECREAYDNMTGGGMSDEHPKVQAFDEAAQYLEDAQEPDLESVPEAALDAEVTYGILRNKDKRRADARWARCSTACNALEAAEDSLRNHFDDLDDEDDDRQSIEDLADELGEIRGNAEGAEFPGMFG